MNDNLAPNEPTDLTVGEQSVNYITLGWTKTIHTILTAMKFLYATYPRSEPATSKSSTATMPIILPPHDCQQINVTGSAIPLLITSE
jgi:hypothetical protein